MGAGRDIHPPAQFRKPSKALVNSPAIQIEQRSHKSTDIDMKTEDLPYALDIFNEGFEDRDAGWLNWECKAIRKWIGNKYYA